MSFLLRTFGPVSGPSPKRNRRRNPFWRFRRFVFAIGLTGLLVVGAGLYAFNQTEVTDDPFQQLLAQTSLICTAEISDVGGCDDERSAAQLSLEEIREIVEYENLPGTIINTTLAAEDASFFKHSGIDPKGLTRAVYQTATGGNIQGGSTITQQLVKLSIVGNKKTIFRKAEEAALSIQLEKEITQKKKGVGRDNKRAAKEEILERYLNQIYYGRQAYGVQAASRTYFDKGIDELTISEAALLASQIRSPGRDPLVNPERTRIRVAAVINIMERNEFAEPSEIAAARQEDVVANLKPYEPAENLGNVKGEDVGSKYFLEAVRIELERIYPNNQSYTGGFRVYTTLDLEKQRMAFETVTANPQPDNPEFRSSIVTVDAQGRVVAMVGGTDFEENRFNLATNGLENGNGRQPGSTFKPFALAELVERGDSAKSLFDTPQTLVLKGANDGKDWKPGGRRSGKKPYLDAVEGMERSSNYVYAQMALEVTPQKIVDTAQRMGVRSELRPFNAVVLGTENVAPLDMAGSYSTFEREGEMLRPALIERIENAEGEVLCWYPDPEDPATDCSDRDGRSYESKERPVRRGSQAIRPETARNVNASLEGVVTSGHGTGKRARVDGRKVAGKTGTTQDNKDGWFVGFTCDATTAVWVGNDDNTPLSNARGEDIGGGDLPASMWSQYMTSYLADAPECGGDDWPVSRDYRGEVLNKELKNRIQKSRIPCYDSGRPEIEDPTKGGKKGPAWINCIPFNAQDLNDRNNPNNPNSPYFFGNPNSPTNANNPNSPFSPGNRNGDETPKPQPEEDVPQTTVVPEPVPVPVPVPEPEPVKVVDPRDDLPENVRPPVDLN